MDAARARGRLSICPWRLTADQVRMARQMVARLYGAQEVARTLNISRSTLYRALRRAGEPKNV